MLLVTLASPAHGEAPSVGSVTELSGLALVTHAAVDQSAPLRVQDDVLLLDQIETKEGAVVRVLLGGRATVTVRELSVLTVTEDLRRSIVDLQGGKLALKIAKGTLKPGESVEVHTPNAIVGIRGSLVVVEVKGSADAPQSTFTALEATHPIEVSSRSDPSRVVSLAPNQTVHVSGLKEKTTITPVRTISRNHARLEAKTAETPGDLRHGAHRSVPAEVSRHDRAIPRTHGIRHR